MKPCPFCSVPIVETKQACNSCWAQVPLETKKQHYELLSRHQKGLF